MFFSVFFVQSESNETKECVGRGNKYNYSRVTVWLYRFNLITGFEGHILS